MKPMLFVVWSSSLVFVLPATAAGGEPFRIGVSYASFGNANLNDASAAMKIWASTVVREGKLEVDVQVDVVGTTVDLRRALAENKVEGVSMTAEEFFESGERPEYLYLTAKDTGCLEEYVVLVHRESDLQDLRGLKGKRLVRHVSPNTNPSMAWFETELARLELGRATNFLGDMLTLDSASKSILRVFFHQSDACLVGTNAFALACELNPQLRQQLKVLAVSPGLVPGLFFFRPTYTSPQRDLFENTIVDLHKSVMGQQLLTVFQTVRMDKVPVSCFEPTRQLLERYRQLNCGTPSVPSGAGVASVGGEASDANSTLGDRATSLPQATPLNQDPLVLAPNATEP